MTLATFAIILSAVALASSMATLVYAVRIRAFIQKTVFGVEDRLKEKFRATMGTVTRTEQNIKQHVTAALTDLGLAQKPEQK